MNNNSINNMEAIERIRNMSEEEFEALKRMVGITDAESNTKTEEQTICVILKKLGMPTHIKGYDYAKEAISLMIAEPELRSGITKILYPTVAKKFITTPSRVERAIRHAIEISWVRADIEYLHEVFGDTTDSNRGKPTNAEFISMVAEYIRVFCK